jgi:hypothetical protein
MKQMVCGIIFYLIEKVAPPKSSLAEVLGLHSTRIAAVIERKHWPKTLGTSPRQFLLIATLWILLGDKWETALDEYQKLKRLMSAERWLRFSNAERDNFMEVSCCFDIVEYFFTLPGSIPQPWFYSERKEWNGPYDKREMQKVLEWTRRQMLAYDKFQSDKDHGLIAFFTADLVLADQLLDKVYLRPAVALAALQLKTLSINMYIGCFPDDQLKNRVDLFVDSVAQLAREQDEPSFPWRDWTKKRNLENGKGDFMHLLNFSFLRNGAMGKEINASKTKSETDARAGETDSPGIVAMMFLGYYREEDCVMRRREHVFLCRPYLDASNRLTPFCLRVTQVEKERFLEQQRARFCEFSAALDKFRLSNEAELAEDDDI